MAWVTGSLARPECLGPEDHPAWWCGCRKLGSYVGSAVWSTEAGQGTPGPTEVRASPLQLLQIHHLLADDTAGTVACGRAYISNCQGGPLPGLPTSAHPPRGTDPGGAARVAAGG